MAGSQILTKNKVWFDGYDVQADVSAVAFNYSAEPQDATTFAEDTRVNKGGLKALDFTMEGFWRGGTSQIDDVLFGEVGLGDSKLTVSSSGDPQVGAVVYMAKGVVGGYTPLAGSVGDMAGFTLDAAAEEQFVRGRLLHDSTGISTSGNGSAVSIGQIASGQKVYGVLHVVGAAGTTNTITVTVQRDSSSSFASPSTVLTFTQQTDNGSDWQVDSSTTTETFYRVSHTVAGATADFEYVAGVGIV